jgi:hypothetical protein
LYYLNELAPITVNISDMVILSGISIVAIYYVRWMCDGMGT